MDIEIRDGKLFVHNKLIGVIANDGTWLVDFDKIRRDFSFDGVISPNAKNCFIRDSFASLEYLGTITPKIFPSVDVEYYTIFVDKDREIAYLGDIAIPLEELEIATSYMMLENLFVVYPKYVAIPVPAKNYSDDAKRILVISSNLFNFSAYYTWLVDNRIEFRIYANDKQYELVDTTINVLNYRVFDRGRILEIIFGLCI